MYKSGFLIFYHYVSCLLFSSAPLLIDLVPQTALIDMDPGPQFIELLSWNDFGESHYLGSTRTNYGPPAGSEGYANKDFDHTPLLTASAFYNAWFKTGSSPVIKTEGVIWYHRPHPKDLVASSDPVPKPEGADTMDDAIYVACFVPSGSKAANVIVTTGGKASEPKSVKEGVNLIQVPLVPGDVAVVSSLAIYAPHSQADPAVAQDLVDGDGKSLLSGKGVAIDSEISVYNFVSPEYGSLEQPLGSALTVQLQNYRAYILPEGADASYVPFAELGVLQLTSILTECSWIPLVACWTTAPSLAVREARRRPRPRRRQLREMRQGPRLQQERPTAQRVRVEAPSQAPPAQSRLQQRRPGARAQARRAAEGGQRPQSRKRRLRISFRASAPNCLVSRCAAVNPRTVSGRRPSLVALSLLTLTSQILQLYVWIPLILAVPILILIAYIFTSHGTHAPRDADAGQAQHRRRLLSRDEAVSGSKGYSSSDEDEEEDRRWPRR